MGRIDEGEGASIGAAIFIEDAAEGLAADLDFWDESILGRGMRHADLQIGNATDLLRASIAGKNGKVKETCIGFCFFDNGRNVLYHYIH